MDEKKNEINGELSTEELIRRLMENFSDDEPSEQEGNDAGEDLSFTFDADSNGEAEEVEMPEIPSFDEDEEAEKEPSSEKFKFRVQKSKVVVGAAIPKMAPSFEGVIGQEESEQPMPEEEPKEDAPAELAFVMEETPESEESVEEPEQEETDDYAEIEQLAKDALEEQTQESKAEDAPVGVFSGENPGQFGQLSEDDVNLMMIFGEEDAGKGNESSDAISEEKTYTNLMWNA